MLPFASPAPATAGPEQPGFADVQVLTGLTQPTAVEFSSDGRVFVAQKNGIIRVFPSVTASSSTVFADLRTRVHDFWDRGLLGLALHPDFPADGRVYVLYTHDATIGGTAPRWGDSCPNPPGATVDGCVVSGRLSVLVASGDTAGPETVLIEDWCQQYPSHSIGDLRFGEDGALYASGGDGASFNWADYGQGGGSSGSPVPRNPCGDPPVPVGGTPTVPTAEGGALRAQDLRTPADPTTLDGAILRLNPDTGAAMAGNPLAGATDPNAARVIAHGLRNPFRFTMRPGTNEVWTGDVGWSSFEEINRIVPSSTAVRNFGWPCYEGATNRPGTYRDTNICVGLYGSGGAAAPYFQYAHGQQVANETCSTGSGSSITGLAFYEGGTYPAQYNGALFFADYSRRCIWVMLPGSNGMPDPATRTAFISSAGAPVQLKIGPGGDLFYVNLSGGAVHRVRYVTANQPPVAVIGSTATTGPAPLTVDFDGSASTDPEAGALTYSWDLNGDGVFGDATTAIATQQYQAGVYTVRLRVTDPAGATGLASVQVEAGSTGVQRYLSDLPFVSATNGWGPVERDRSNGEQASGDGRPITLNGVVYAKGLGVHAASDVRLLVPADCTRLLAAVGLDDEVDAFGSVRFEVYTDATLRFASSIMSGASTTELVDLPVTPGQTLRLVATDGGDNIDYDHADWADARFLCGGGNTAPTARIDLPTPDTEWTANDVIFFTGRGLDNEEGQLPSAALAWEVVLHHCVTPSECHEHPLRSLAGVSSGTFEAQDHEYPVLLEIRLSVTDAGGLSDTASVTLQPQTTDLTFTTEPSGLELTIGSGTPQTAPFTHRMVVGGQTSVSAPTVQVRDGTSYEFVGWADSPDANRQIVAGSEATTYTARYEAAGQVSTTYLSDLPFVSATNGWGPVERDRSNGEQASGDGRPITLNGVVYAKGLGVHAASDVRLLVPADCTRLLAAVGLDDEVDAFGSVRFEVYTDATLRFASSIMSGASTTELVDLPVTPGQTLRLVATDGGDNIDYDHADWADARFLCGGGAPPNGAPVLTDPPDQIGVEGDSISLQLSATDPDGDAVTYNAIGLPPGVSIVAGSGLISGTLAAGSAAGSPYSVTATASDERGASASQTFSWTISERVLPAPTGVVATATTVDTELAWTAVAGAAGYNVYRASASAGPFLKLNAAPITTTTYVDTTASPTSSSWYQLVAVSPVGTESEGASVVAHRRIQLVGASSAVNRATSSVIVDAPAGHQAGDVMLATVTVSGSPGMTPPSGWVALRVDTSGSALRQAVFYRIVTADEPSTLTWTLQQATGAGVVVALYRGVSATAPIESHSGLVNAASTEMPTNAIVTATNHAVVVGLYGVAWNTSITHPDVLDERAEVAMQRGRHRLALGMGDLVRPTPGSSGVLTAVSGRSAVSIGQLIALRPASP